MTLPLALASLSAFLMLLGLGVIFPVLGHFTRELGLSDLQAGLLIGVYAGASFVTAPLWGRFSDRVGRKPVLVIGLAGFSLAFGLFALGSTFTQLLVARLLGGLLAGGSMGTLLAYTADISPPERRSMALGIIGASFGLGALCGPVLGGVLAAGWGPRAAFWVTAGIGALASLGTALLLPESLTPEIRKTNERRRKELAVVGLGRLGIAAALGPFLLYSFLLQMGRTAAESTVYFLIEDRLQGGPREVGLLFGGMGLVAVLVQGGGIRLLSARYGDASLVVAGAVIQLAGLLVLGFAHTWTAVIFAALLIGAGSALLTPTFTAELSRAAPDLQGEAQGLNASMQSLARAVGPVVFSALYLSEGGALRAAAPYLAAVSFCALGVFLAWRGLRVRLPDATRARLGSVES